MKAAQNLTREKFAVAARDLVHSGETRDQSDLRSAVLSAWTWAEHPVRLTRHLICTLSRGALTCDCN